MWLFFLSLFLPLHSKPKSIEPLISGFEKAWAEVKSYQSDFKQTIISKELGSSEESTGTLSVSKPGRLRWESNTEGSIQILNGPKYYNIQENKRRGNRVVDVYKNVKKTANLKPLAFLTENFKVREVYQVKLASETKDLAELKLQVKGHPEEVLVAEIDKKSYLLRALVTENSESRVRIELLNTKANLALPDSLFEYQAGPKDLVHEQ